MFTGLVEALGTVRGVIEESVGRRIEIDCSRAWPDEPAAIGESIAINGCCLTVVADVQGTWSFQAGPETLSRTNLGSLQPGDSVNLERALRVQARLGGHFVQGHVDGVGQVLEVCSHGDWVDMRFRVPSGLASQIVSKGSVAVDGVSLTVVEAARDWFSVALIPHTLQNTTLGSRRVGDEVNLETDILAKYVQRLLFAGSA